MADVMHNNSRAYGRNMHKVARRSNVSAKRCIRSVRSIEACVVLRDECSELLDFFQYGLWQSHHGLVTAAIRCS